MLGILSDPKIIHNIKKLDQIQFFLSNDGKNSTKSHAEREIENLGLDMSTQFYGVCHFRKQGFDDDERF